MFPYIVVIVVGAIAWRGASAIVYDLRRDPGSVPAVYLNPEGFWNKAVTIYAIAAPLPAAVNGYALGGLPGLFIVLVGTWAGMLLANIFLRFSPGLQFAVFGFVNVLVTLFLLDRL
jgi:hypothetical protein